MALFQNNSDINQIADHILVLLDFKTLINLEQINTLWSRHLRDPKVWLRLCMKKEAKWFKYQDQDSNQTFVEYKSANLQWYNLLEGLDDSHDETFKKSLLMHLKLRYKTALKLTETFTYVHITPFAFAAKCGNLDLVKHIVTKTDPFKKMKCSAMIDVDQGEVLNDEVVPFDPTLIPIHTASRFGHWELVKYLMETYSHLNEAIDEFNLTPIEHAVIKNHKKVVKHLLRFPMRDDIKNRAFDLAIEKEMYGIAFKINKWNTIRAIDQFIGRSNTTIVVLIVLMVLDIMAIIVILYVYNLI